MSNLIDLLPKVKDGENLPPKFCTNDPQFLNICGAENYEIATRPLYVSNFMHYLLKLCNLFQYENLPIPAVELEIRLIMQGFCTIFHTDKWGWVTGWGSLNGISKYNHFTNWLVTQPVLGEHAGVIGKDGFVIYNTQLDKNGGSMVLSRLQYYAKQMTDLQVSLDMYTINTRAMTAVITRDDQTQSSLTEFYKRLKEGDLSYPLAANGVLPTHAPLMQPDREYFKPLDIIECMDRLDIRFAEEFGISKLQEKPERMVVEEVQADQSYLTWNIAGMAYSRLEGFDDFNTATGSNVKLSYIGG